ncbi:MAG: ArgR family transcriptional regulator [Muribaculaceae bacterium]|mgnify:FL=1|nr:ArgR family transcriptional regulator [Muribaculaceae bacterium]
MKKKRNRLQLITELVKNNCIGSQDELAHLLAGHGHVVTQATLSRDLKALRITKISTEYGHYMYVVHENISNDFKKHDEVRSATHGSMTLEFSGNFAVIKSRIGYAMGIAYDIDVAQVPEVLGTIAGSDTVFALLREGVTHDQAVAAFKNLFPVEVLN